MIYHIAYMNGIKADIAKKEITVSFTVDMSDVNMEVSQDLSRYTDTDSGAVEIEISPRQMKLDLPDAFRKYDVSARVIEKQESDQTR